jgi:hypothetical protein
VLQLFEKDIQFDTHAPNFNGIPGDHKIDCTPDPDIPRSYEMTYLPPNIVVKGRNPWVSIDDCMVDEQTAKIYVVAGASMREIAPPTGRRSLIPSRRSTTGPLTVLVVRVIAADASTTSSVSQLSDSVFGTHGDAVNLRSQFLACSNNQLDFQPYAGTTATGQVITNGVAEVTISNTVLGQSDSVIVNSVSTAFSVKVSALACCPCMLLLHVAVTVGHSARNSGMDTVWWYIPVRSPNVLFAAWNCRGLDRLRVDLRASFRLQRCLVSAHQPPSPA